MIDHPASKFDPLPLPRAVLFTLRTFLRLLAQGSILEGPSCEGRTGYVAFAEEVILFINGGLGGRYHVHIPGDR